MLNLFNQFKNTIFTIVISILLTLLVYLWIDNNIEQKKHLDKISFLEKDIQECTLMKETEKGNNLTLQTTIKDMNDLLIKNSIDYDSKLKVFEENRLKLVKQLNKVGSNDCKDIKDKLDSFRGIDYSGLLK